MSVGFVKDGKYQKSAGNLSILNTPVADESTNGLMSYQDKQKLDDAYTTQDVASKETIEGLFN